MYEDFFRYLDILNESRIYATRHISDEEKAEKIEILKDAIRNHRAELVVRDKNTEFMEQWGLDYLTSLHYIYEFVKPEDLLAPIRDRNNHNRELYLCITKVPRKEFNLFLYTKFAINEDGSVTIISFHDDHEKEYVNYEYATDYYDNSFNEKVMKKTKYNYIKFKNKNPNELVDCSCVKRIIRFFFKEEVDENTKNGIIMSIPNDMGLEKAKMISNFNIEGNCLEMKVSTRSFEKR